MFKVHLIDMQAAAIAKAMLSNGPLHNIIFTVCISYSTLIKLFVSEYVVPYSELHQDGLLAACQDVSSDEEEDVRSQLLLTSRVSSRESIRTAVSERGYR